MKGRPRPEDEARREARSRELGYLRAQVKSKCLVCGKTWMEERYFACSPPEFWFAVCSKCKRAIK